jgi:hypothetical protein
LDGIADKLGGFEGLGDKLDGIGSSLDDVVDLLKTIATK